MILLPSFLAHIVAIGLFARTASMLLQTPRVIFTYLGDKFNKYFNFSEFFSISS